jgi:hypothetical protein
MRVPFGQEKKPFGVEFFSQFNLAPGIKLGDIDNDGWIDLAAIVQTAAGPRVKVFRNKGDGSFEDVSHALGLDSVALKAPRGLIAADVDGDGEPDLIVTQLNAAPLLLRNVGANKNHFVRLDLSGYADNKTALGSKVEIFANGQWQKWELAGASGFQTQAPPQILIGLGEAEGIDLLRILWPTGILQDEIDLPQTQVIAMKEADRRGSSCPVLFAWDGHKYKLVTDVIGAAVVGHWFTPTRRNTPNPGEWIKVDGDKVAAVDGKLSLRFIEPMEEVNYIDQLRLDVHVIAALGGQHGVGVEAGPWVAWVVDRASLVVGQDLGALVTLHLRGDEGDARHPERNRQDARKCRPTFPLAVHSLLLFEFGTERLRGQGFGPRAEIQIQQHRHEREALGSMAIRQPRCESRDAAHGDHGGGRLSRARVVGVIEW